MNFIADEGVDGSLVAKLRAAGHDVLYFAETDQSTDDEVILELSNRENRILITRDKDFGELIYRMKRIHAGIILVRLEELTSALRAQIAASFIFENLEVLSGHFIVLQPSGARIRQILS
ncbi:MAG: DUF5615 family PIN-like protein [Saprospiraceae bacterium]